MLPATYQSTFPQQIVLVTAAAGSGKTFTAMELVRRLAQMGHRHIVYVSFTKATVREARNRFAAPGATPPGAHVECRTLHSLAWSIVVDTDADLDIEPETQASPTQTQSKPQAAEVPTAPAAAAAPPSKPRMIKDEWDLEKLVRDTVCTEAIAEFLAGVPADKADSEVRRITMYIFKTFVQWCRQGKPTFSTQQNNNCYYPAVLYHQNRLKNGPKRTDGTPQWQEDPRIIETFYIKCAIDLWQYCEAHRIFTYSTTVKKAQVAHKLGLAGSQVPGSAVVVDEAQDMNGCALEWMKQLVPTRQVFLVGDLAQSIYRFNGARPSDIAGLPPVTLCKRSLTRSFRFGPTIAAVANTVLFAKRFSLQTVPERNARGCRLKSTWVPYRVVGAAPGRADQITSELLLPGTAACPRVTYLARTNAALFLFYLSSLAGGGWRVALNGKGDGSGVGKWRALTKSLQAFYDVYTGKKGTLPNRSPFLRWEGRKGLTWYTIKRDVEENEMTNLYLLVGLIETHRDSLPGKMEQFYKGVLSKQYDPDDPETDAVLSTVHAAKGMEWEHVQVLNDDGGMSKLAEWGICAQHDHHRFQKAQFTAENFTEDLNIWYVAVTRARRTLGVPEAFAQLLLKPWPDLLGEAHTNLRAGVRSLWTIWKTELAEELVSVPGGFDGWVAACTEWIRMIEAMMGADDDASFFDDDSPDACSAGGGGAADDESVHAGGGGAADLHLGVGTIAVQPLVPK